MVFIISETEREYGGNLPLSVRFHVRQRRMGNIGLRASYIENLIA